MRSFTQIATMLLVAILLSGANCFESCLVQLQQDFASTSPDSDIPCHGEHSDPQKEAPMCAHRELVAEKQVVDALSVKASWEATAPATETHVIEPVVPPGLSATFALSPPGPARSSSRSILRI